nr:ESPR-type extended signal peptide-containing protein [Paraburkholderia sp.]
MNKSYRSVWNESTGTWMAVQETARARGKKARSARVAAFTLVSAAAGAAHAGALDGGTAATGSLAYGTGATTAGGNQIAIGIGTKVLTTTNDAGMDVAIGYKALITANGSYAIAIGGQATVDGGAGIAIGSYSYAGKNTYATALGYGASATGSGATAIGLGAVSSGNTSNAMGSGSSDVDQHGCGERFAVVRDEHAGDGEHDRDHEPRQLDGQCAGRWRNGWRERHDFRADVCRWRLDVQQRRRRAD